jgi:hypothetical protein
MCPDDVNPPKNKVPKPQQTANFPHGSLDAAIESHEIKQGILPPPEPDPPVPPDPDAPVPQVRGDWL